MISVGLVERRPACTGRLLPRWTTSTIQHRDRRPPSMTLSPRRRAVTITILLGTLQAMLPTGPLEKAKASSTAGSVPKRTVFDEERARNDEIEKAARQARAGRARAKFDAVRQTAERLDKEVNDLIQKEDWNELREYSRRFNNNIRREGMEDAARGLEDKSARKRVMEIGKQVTDALRQVDRGASHRDVQIVHEGTALVAKLVSEFDKFRP